jgi:transcriptional regulator GlxA family with amidase domain
VRRDDPKVTIQAFRVMIRVTCLLYDGFQLLDVAGPMAVFETAGYAGPDGYVFEIAAETAGPVRSSGGAVLQAKALKESAGFDTLFVPGGPGARDLANTRGLLPTVRRAAREGRRIVSVSSAAFILAEAGVLEGRRAVTHWSAAARLADRHPRIRVDGDALFAHEGNIWTSAGSLAGADLALALVEQDYGAARAARIAHALLTFRRPGAQPQEPALLKSERPLERFSDIVAWAREHLDESLSVERLADRAALSVRQFTRAFRESVGVSPAKFVEALRIERARALIEGGARSLEEVARASGFGSAERMRRSFVRAWGRTPREIRRTQRR